MYSDYSRRRSDPPCKQELALSTSSTLRLALGAVLMFRSPALRHVVVCGCLGADDLHLTTTLSAKSLNSAKIN
jgi:hypothetical protein